MPWPSTAVRTATNGWMGWIPVIYRRPERIYSIFATSFTSFLVTWFEICSCVTIHCFGHIILLAWVAYWPLWKPRRRAQYLVPMASSFLNLVVFISMYGALMMSWNTISNTFRGGHNGNFHSSVMVITSCLHCQTWYRGTFCTTVSWQVLKVVIWCLVGGN